MTYGRNFRKFGDVSQRSPRMCKLSLMGDSVELRRPRAPKNEDRHKVPDGNPECAGNWTVGHLCYIVAKSSTMACHLLPVAAFFPFAKRSLLPLCVGNM